MTSPTAPRPVVIVAARARVVPASRAVAGVSAAGGAVFALDDYAVVVLVTAVD